MKRVLFVDDDTSVLESLQRTLHSMRKGWEMTFVRGGEAALAVLSIEHYDIIVSDIHMPGMGGVELLAVVKDRFPKMVRIALSGHSQPIKNGLAYEFLAKPCDADTLAKTIDRALAVLDTLPSPKPS